MQYVPGEDLGKVLQQQQTLKLANALEIIYFLADALQSAQKSAIIHRDIKPSNIFLPNNSKVPAMFLDFGLGKCLEDYWKLTKFGDTLGTPPYMAPEQIREAKHADHRSDIYGLGATLFHMLAGKKPYGEFWGNQAIMFAKARKSQYAQLSQLRPNLPQKVCDIVARTMAHEREDRQQSANELKANIANFIRGL